MERQQTIAPVLPSRTNPALLGQLEYMAYHGRDETVRELYRKLSPREREAYQSVSVLNSVARGGIALVRKSRSIVPPADGAFAEPAAAAEGELNQFISYCKERSIGPRELFERILDWSSEVAARTEDTLRLLQRAEELNIRSYPDLHAGLELTRAKILFEMGRLQEAHWVVSVLAGRHYLIPDRNLISRILYLLCQTSLLTGEAGHLKNLLFGGLRHFYTGPETRRLFTDLLGKVYRRPHRVLLDRGRTASDRILFMVHWLDYRAVTSWFGRKSRLDRATRFAVLALVYFLNYVVRRHGAPLVAPSHNTNCSAPDAAGPKEIPHSDPKKAILIVRAMGGIGDLLAMTPGFHALKEAYPDHEIHLAVPRQYHSLFTGNPDVVVFDSEKTAFETGSYAKWFNLTDCPAARVESRAVPEVRMNRIEIFARSLGVRGKKLRTMDRRPRYFLSDREREFQCSFWKRHRLAGRTVIGVQLQAAEAYRDYPHMAELVRSLASFSAVILFHTGRTAIPAGNGVIDPSPLPLREAVALASGCHVIVAPDSSFVHFAGALNLPCVALYGPVDGVIRTGDYPSCVSLDARRVLHCVPCWRNEVIPCKLTNLRNSACMENIAVGDVVAAVLRKIKERKHEAERPLQNLR